MSKSGKKEGRALREEDVPEFISQIFSKFDSDKNNHFTRLEFPKVIKVLTDMVGVMEPKADDVDDLFNLIDVNGDETLDRKELTSLLTMFFKVLRENDIEIKVGGESDLIKFDNPSQ